MTLQLIASTPAESREDQVNRIYEHAPSLTREAFGRELERAEARGYASALAAEFVTIQEAAVILRCCRESIYNYIKAGKLHYVTSVSGRRLIRRGELLSQAPMLRRTREGQEATK